MDVIELFLASHSNEYHVAYSKYTHTQVIRLLFSPFDWLQSKSNFFLLYLDGDKELAAI